MPFGTGFMPGENDWMYRLFGGGPFGAQTGGQGGPLGAAPAPAAVPSTISGGLFGKFASKLNEGLTKMQTDPTSQLGLRVLANSGYAPHKRGLGEILGTSMLQNQQANQETSQNDLQRRYMEAQIGAMNRKPAQTPFGDVNPAQYTPESIAAFQKTISAGTPDYSVLQNNPKASDAPSNVREYEYFNKLSPQEKQQYLEMKRTLNPFTMDEMGGGKVAFDKRSGVVTPLTSATQEATGQSTIASAKAAATETGTKTADTAFDLPRVEQNTQQSIDTIDKLINHPGLQYITGISSKVPVVPGTSQAAADALAKQVEGQTFLQAYQTLRGGGAITEVEGQKGTAAIARLQRSQSKGDYQAALKDAREVFKTGMERMKKQAGVDTTAKPRKRYNPQTGKIE